MNKSVKKRDRKSETSLRLVRCYYYNAEKEFKDLKSHCKGAHNKPPRKKGQLSLSEYFLKPNSPLTSKILFGSWRKSA